MAGSFLAQSACGGRSCSRHVSAVARRWIRGCIHGTSGFGKIDDVGHQPEPASSYRLLELGFRLGAGANDDDVGPELGAAVPDSGVAGVADTEP